MVATYHPAVAAAEKQLVSRAIARDTTAFAELYDTHVVRVYRHINYLVNNPHTAEDLTSQTYLKAWEAIDRYQEQGKPFVAWLIKIGHNLTISYLRSKREHCSLDETFVDGKLHSNPAEVIEQITDGAAVRAAIMRLNDDQQQVILLRFGEGMNYAEVAAIMGRSLPAIRILQFRALKKLREILEDNPPSL